MDTAQKIVKVQDSKNQEQLFDVREVETFLQEAIPRFVNTKNKNGANRRS